MALTPVRNETLAAADPRALPSPVLVDAAPPIVPENALPLSVGREAFDSLVREIGEPATVEIIALFVRETKARLARLRQLSIDAEARAIEREAHSLKSAAGTFGLADMARLARQIEGHAHRMSADEYDNLVGGIEAVFGEALAQPIAEAVAAIKPKT